MRAGHNDTDFKSRGQQGYASQERSGTCCRNPFQFLTVQTPALAKNYPSGPVRLVLGMAPGGPVDGMTRLCAEAMSQRLGQNFVVENKLDAGKMIAANEVLIARPEG